MTDPQKDVLPEATPSAPHSGPSWGFMLAIVFLAMLVATGIAWLFIHPFMLRR